MLFYFILKPLFVCKIYKFLSQLDEKDQVNFKIHDVTTWFTNHFNAHISQISQSKDNRTMKFGQLREYNRRNVFLQKLFGK